MSSWLETTMLNCVPKLEDAFVVPNDWEIADIVNKAKGTSLYRDGKEPREGIVCRNELEHVSFKVINPDFLLKEDA